MRLILKILVGALAVAVLAVGAIYVASERKLHRDIPLGTFVVAPGASAERGRREVQLRGCDGCHGKQLEGQDLTAHAPVLIRLLYRRATTPTLGDITRDLTDAQLERALRHGVASNGRALAEMPSFFIYYIDDADLSDIIAYLRSLPPVEHSTSTVTYGPLIRLQILLGYDLFGYGPPYPIGPFYVDSMMHDAPRFPASSTDPMAEGSYLAHSICSECHGVDLHGGAADPPVDPTVPPDLAIVQAYSRADFGKLLNGGIGLGGRKLGLWMTEVGQHRTPHLTDDEVSDLYTYLHQLAPGSSHANQGK
jgi:mono/diheme cytochrome c family protein